MRSKLARFKHNARASNVVQSGKPLIDKIKGKWNIYFFAKKQPITLELACGRGEYTIGLARKFSQRNFVGVDIKGDRIWQGSSIAINDGLQNVGFLRIFIHDITDYFDISEVDEIWLTFPDPRPKDRDEKRRLTYTRFLELYKTILVPEGWFKFKTDNSGLFDYTLNLLESRQDIIDLTYTNDLNHSGLLNEHYDITTHYEQKFRAKGEKIKYLKFRFKPSI